MVSRIPVLFSILMVSFAGAAGQFHIGTPGSLLDRLETEKTGPNSLLTLYGSSAEPIQVEVQDFHSQDGYVSLSGAVRGIANSDFMLKGDRNRIYGWIVIKDRKLAYEYSTDGQGSLVVEQVEVTKIYPDCDPPPDQDDPSPQSAIVEEAPAAAGPEPHIGPYPGTSVRKLQSLPGAPKVLWMNINRVMTGETPKGWTKAQIWEMWQGFAAGFSMYNVNVTTDSSVWAEAGVRNGGIANLYNEDGRSSCGVNSFGSTRGCTVYRKSTAKYSAGTLIHEVGHLLGLSHDGSPSGDYYGGFSTFQWCPIMGNHTTALRWTSGLWQWSKGEYANANQKQDDLTVMGRHLDFREDDIKGSLPLKMTGDSVTALLNRGQISRNSDADTFSFQIARGGGRARLKVDRTEYIGGSMLDVDAAIIDSAGKQVTRNNASAARHAQFDMTLPAGRYELVVKGGAEGSSSNGFSSYSSLGFYAIEGALMGGVVALAEAADLEKSIRIEPLTAASRLGLHIPGHAKVKAITLFSIRGDKVFESRKRIESIDLSGLPAGYYGLRVAVEGATVDRRIANLRVSGQ